MRGDVETLEVRGRDQEGDQDAPGGTGVRKQLLHVPAGRGLESTFSLEQ